MFLGQAEAQAVVRGATAETIAESNLSAEIEELNLRMAASEDYKKYGLYIGVAMLVLRMFKK